MKAGYGQILDRRRMGGVSLLAERRQKTLKKINKLLESIERNGILGGEGHPEPLKGNFSGWYSRQIDAKNRLLYRIKDERLEILSCREHYGDR